jgi:hypothetical protein
MENLEKILTDQTQDLKNLYIRKTEEWASFYYNLVKERKFWTVEKWCDFLGIEPEVKNQGQSNEYKGFPKNFFNSKESKIYHNYYGEALKMASTTLDKFKTKEKERAERHYKASILKLVDRVSKKNLDNKNLKVETSKLGVNFEATISDGSKTVKAWTIVASGDIQRPHYRYLVK